MSTITFLSADLDEKEIKVDEQEKMKDVCKRYADEINKNIKNLVFYSNGKKLHKKMTVSEFINTNSERELYVVLMDEDIYSESEEEISKSKKLKEKIVDCFIRPKKEMKYDESLELIAQYGSYCKKRIEKEKKEHPENFIEIEDAINNKENNNKLLVLGKLGKSLESMGIEVAIDRREGENKEDSLIVNQIISSGIMEEIKYEIHYKENDINKKYAVINDEEGEQEKFIKKFKGLLSKKTGFSEKNIILSNIREGCVCLDAIIKNEGEDKDKISKKMEEFSKSDNIECINEKNILEACKLSPDMLDQRGDRDPSEWPKKPQERGGMPYNPPDNNWVGYGLKVLDEYDGGNNDWIAMNGNPKEWAVAFHGTGVASVNPICKKGGKFYSRKVSGEAFRQKCEKYPNMNKRNQNIFKECGVGAYVSPSLDTAKYYANQNSTPPVVIMCRVDPYQIRIPEGLEEQEWITDGTRNTVRPYRILINLNNK